jgi:peptide chain release factor 2
VDRKQQRIAGIEQEMAKANFWDSGQAAQDMVKELRVLSSLVKPLQSVTQRTEDLAVLIELAQGEPDDSAWDEVRREMDTAEHDLSRLELRAMFSGPNDFRNAYVSIHAGAGGTESCDWAEMLVRMYSRWAEIRGYDREIIDWQEGEQAGVRSVTLLFRGDWTFGLLQSEIGVHRLVRISPFDANKRRHTSFASVDVIAEVEEDTEIDVKEGDVRVDTYRASGAGGQHVNKTSSAVRITHIPTGIVVQCQNERSQQANRRTAMKLLRARLLRIEQQKREEEIGKLYSEKGEIAWGNQIRSYVLQPYQMVKDHRTEVETGKVESVLDGEIDLFIETFLRRKMGAGKA